MNQNDPIADIVLERWIESKKAKIKLWPCHVNRASNLGHPCELKCVLARTHWDKAALHDWTLQAIFDEGNRHEEAVEDDLREAKFKIIEQQRPYVWKEYTITGHTDGKLIIDGLSFPYETKSMSPFMYNTVNSIEDMLNHKYPYMRAYPAQMNLYLLLGNEPHGLFILKNKSTGQLKFIDVYLDYEYTEKLVQKAERINKHIKEGTQPDGVDDASICDRCGFLHICLPERGGVEFTTGKIIDLLDERAIIMEEIDKSPVPEYQKRVKEIMGVLKKVFKDRPHVIAGDYLITGKWKGAPGGGKYWSVDIAGGNQ